MFLTMKKKVSNNVPPWISIPRNENQLEYFTAPLTNGVLIAPPGSGKTTSIIGRTMCQIQTGVTPIKSCLILTFSKQSKIDFIDRVGKLCPSYFDAHEHIRTIHSLSGTILKKFANKSSSLNTAILRAKMILEKVNEEDVRKNIRALKSIKVIRVDEAQDINRIQYEFVNTLGCLLKVPVELIGDPYQNIYQFQGGSDVYLRSHDGFRVYLIHNYRSNNVIVNLVNASQRYLTPDIGQPLMMAFRECSNVHKPSLICERYDKIESHIISTVLKHLHQNKSVAIIGSVRKSRCNRFTGEYTSIGLNTVSNTLDQYKIPFIVHYNESDHDGSSHSTKSKNMSDNSCVHMYTCHASKGLEYDVVLFINFHHNLMGLLPTSKIIKENMNQWENLVHVALSRAKDDLYVYCLHDQPVWPSYYTCADHFQIVYKYPSSENRLLQSVEYDSKHFHYAWTDIIKGGMSTEDMADTEDLLNVEVSFKEKIIPSVDIQLPDFDNLSTLYGEWAENMITYIYDKTMLPPCMCTIKQMITSNVTVPSTCFKAVQRLNTILMNSLSIYHWSVIDKYRWQLERDTEIKVLLHVLENSRKLHPEYFTIITTNRDAWFDQTQLTQFINDCNNRELTCSDIWKMCLFLWQYRHNVKYRWFQDYTIHIEKITNYIPLFEYYASNLPPNIKFQCNLQMMHLPIMGIADAISYDTKEIFEFKFSQDDIGTTHGMQIAGYLEMIDGKNAKDWKMNIVNLYTGKLYEVISPGLLDSKTRWKLYKNLSQSLKLQLENTLWVYDLETNHLNPDICDIIEIHIEEYTTGLVPISTLVFQENSGEEYIHGISSKDLIGMPEQDNVMKDLRNILNICKNSMMIAHNGTVFDNKILRRIDTNIQYLTKFGDSKPILQTLIDDTSYKLCSLYDKLCKSNDNVKAHRAAADVYMLCKIMQSLNIDAHQIKEMSEKP